MKIFKLLTSVVVGLAVIAGSAFAYQSLGKPTGYVNDYTGTLSQKTKADLEELLTRFKASGKGEVSVVMISTLGGDSVENYSIELAREWGIGVKGKDNGALLLIAKDDRQLRIEVGYGFEGDLTDAKSSRIIRDVITPRFKEGNYDVGVMNGVKEILGVIDPTFVGGTQTVDYDAPDMTMTGGKDITGIVFWVFAILMAVVMWVVSVLARSKSWWAGGIIGGIFGIIISLFVGFLFAGLITTIVLVLLGLLFDYTISKGYTESKATGTRPPWWTGGSSGGFGGGRSGGGFGGFGGGSFGGGGSSGRW